MKCPQCDAESSVRDSRTHGHVVRRRRGCTVCGYNWKTVEMIDEAVVRRTGAPNRSPDTHPAVRFAHEEAARQGLSREAWSRMSRISVKTIGKTRGARIPRVDTLDAMLLSLGCELIARKRPTTGRRR